jgi:hypothetical protein
MMNEVMIAVKRAIALKENGLGGHGAVVNYPHTVPRWTVPNEMPGRVG